MKHVLSSMNVIVAWAIWIVAVVPIARVDANQWSLNITSLNYDETTDIFTLSHGLDSSINVTEQLRIDVITQQCDELAPILNATSGIVSTSTDSSGVLSLEVDPYTMSKDARLFNYSYWQESSERTGDKNAEINFCVRSSLWTGPESDPVAVQVSAFYTTLTLYIDLTDQVLVDQFVVDKKGGVDPLNTTTIENTDYEVFSYFCDDVTQEPYNPMPIQQGDAITLCVEATQSALERGVYVGYIKEFAWVRNTSSANITQWVIQNGTLVDPMIALYECESPAIVCDFTALMLPSLFATPGAGYGVGEARMAFGPRLRNNTNSTRGRNLLEGNSNRALQEGTLSPFRIDMSISPTSDRPNTPLQTAGGVAFARPWTSVSIFASYVLGSAAIWLVLGL